MTKTCRTYQRRDTEPTDEETKNLPTEKQQNYILKNEEEPPKDLKKLRRRDKEPIYRKITKLRTEK